MAEEGRKVGVVRESESQILERLFLFGDLRAHDVMTPRTVIFRLPADATLTEVIEEHDALPFSRLPIYRDDPNEIDGYVLKDELLRRTASGEGATTLAELGRELIVVPESLALPDVFERLVEEGELISLVVDEHGNVTATDSGSIVLEELDVDNPAVKTFRRAATVFERSYGDGATTLVTLVGGLLDEADRLAGMGLHPTAIERGYREGLSSAVGSLDRRARPLGEVGLGPASDKVGCNCLPVVADPGVTARR